MPTLPTPEVTTTQQARILAAYKAKYGTATAAETAAAFKRAILEMVRNDVLAYEAQQIMDRQVTEREAALAAVRSELPDPGSA